MVDTDTLENDVWFPSEQPSYPADDKNTHTSNELIDMEAVEELILNSSLPTKRPGLHATTTKKRKQKKMHSRMSQTTTYGAIVSETLHWSTVHVHVLITRIYVALVERRRIHGTISSFQQTRISLCILCIYLDIYPPHQRFSWYFASHQGSPHQCLFLDRHTQPYGCRDEATTAHLSYSSAHCGRHYHRGASREMRGLERLLLYLLSYLWIRCHITQLPAAHWHLYIDISRIYTYRTYTNSGPEWLRLMFCCY